MAWVYTAKVKELFSNALHRAPSSYFGRVENPDGEGQHGSISCGDAIVFTMKVKQDPNDPLKDIITKARYETFGCTSAIASSEALCDIVERKHLTPIEALKVSNNEIVEFLGGMPDQKLHCSVMGAEVLKATIKDWASRRGVNLKEDALDVDFLHEDEGTIACTCFNITGPYLKRKMSELGLKNIDQVVGALKAGGACGSCVNTPGGIGDLLKECWGDEAELFRSNSEVPTDLPDDFKGRVELVLEQAIRPEVKKLGFLMELIEIKNNLIYCQFEAESETTDISGEDRLVKTVDSLMKELVHPSAKIIDI